MLEPIGDLASYKKMHGHYGIIGESRHMLEAFGIIEKIASVNVPVIIVGESGTGKEMVAKAVHKESGRSPFVAVNCGALADELLESELFGHKKGAFTGAIYDKKGYFEIASRGTIFLDEILEMNHKMQSDLLRVLQEGEYSRVGDTEVKRTDARVIAAASGGVEEAVRKGTFAEPLFYRLAIVPIELPPLRERGNDILLLARYFCQSHCNTYGMPPLRIDDRASKFLLDGYNWPGNVRELETVLRRVVLLESDKAQERTTEGQPWLLTQEDFANNIKPFRHEKRIPIKSNDEELFSMLAKREVAYMAVIHEYERQLIKSALQRTEGDVTKAAGLLNIARSALYSKIKRLKIEQKNVV